MIKSERPVCAGYLLPFVWFAITAAITTQMKVNFAVAAPQLTSNQSVSGSAARSHAIYLEALGRGGLWGVGYEYFLSNRFSVGTAGSIYYLDDQRTITFSPYLSFYPWISGANRLLLQVGPQFVSEKITSPVPEWGGMSSSHMSALTAAGYEYRSKVLFRIYGIAAMGPNGIMPWIGFSGGLTF